jgi:CBS domain-containing protein
LEISELSTSPVTINRSEPVSKAIGLLQRTKAYEVFVIDEKEVWVLSLFGICSRLSTFWQAR